MLLYAAATIVLALYVIVTGIALFLTYDEQCKTGNDSILCNTVSFIACLLWPVTLLFVAISMQFRRNRASS